MNDETKTAAPSAPGVGLHRRITAGGGSGCGPADPCSTGGGKPEVTPPKSHFGGGNAEPSEFKVVTFNDGEDRRRWVDGNFYLGPKDFPVDQLDPKNRPTAVFANAEDARLFLRVVDAREGAARFLDFLESLSAMKTPANGTMFVEAVSILKDVFGD